MLETPTVGGHLARDGTCGHCSAFRWSRRRDLVQRCEADAFARRARIVRCAVHKASRSCASLAASDTCTRLRIILQLARRVVVASANSLRPFSLFFFFFFFFFFFSNVHRAPRRYTWWQGSSTVNTSVYVARSLIIKTGQTGHFFLVRLRGEHLEVARADTAVPTGFSPQGTRGEELSLRARALHHREKRRN